jgi:hypothetical protein
MAVPLRVDPVADVLTRVFAPLHKRALGLAVGSTAAAALFALTAFHILVVQDGPVPLYLLGQYFYGYEVSWRGAVIGAWWSFVAGFAAGWFLAFLRNFTVATWMFLVKTRAELTHTSDFLDHI